MMVMQMLIFSSWMGLVAIQHAFGSLQAMTRSLEAFGLAEVTLRKAEQQVMTDDFSCRVRPAPLIELVRQRLLPMVHGSVCRGIADGFSYGYCVEFLGVDPCIHIQGTGETAGYVRITLLLQMPQQAGHVILQTVLRKAKPAARPCRGTIQDMPSGRVAWREVEMDIE